MLLSKPIVFNSSNYNKNSVYDNRPKLYNSNILKFTNTQLKFGKAKAIDSEIYYNKEIFKFERFKFFFNVSTPIGVLNQFENKKVVLSNILNNSLLITNNNDEINIFHNVCRHRGCALLSEDSKQDYVKCPYHNWTYGLNGQNNYVPFDDYNDHSNNNLVQLNHNICNNIIFSNLSNRNLDDTTKNALSFLNDYDLINDVSIIKEWEYSINANWKILVENYLDIYRLSNVHPLLTRNLQQREFVPIESNDLNLGYIVHNVLNSGLIIDLDNKRNFAMKSNDFNDVVHFRLIFPNLFIILFPHHLVLFIIDPINHELTNLKIKLLTKSSNDSNWNTKLIKFYESMNLMDISLCESMQKGIENFSFKNGVYNKKYEHTLYKFHNLLINEYTNYM